MDSASVIGLALPSPGWSRKLCSGVPARMTFSISGADSPSVSSRSCRCVSVSANCGEFSTVSSVRAAASAFSRLALVHSECWRKSRLTLTCAGGLMFCRAVCGIAGAGVSHPASIKLQSSVPVAYPPRMILFISMWETVAGDPNQRTGASTVPLTGAPEKCRSARRRTS